MVGTIFTLAHVVIVVLLVTRVLARRRPVGVSLAWISVVLAIPYGGAVLYGMFGETFLGRRRARRAAEMQSRLTRMVESMPQSVEVAWASDTTLAEQLHRLAVNTVGLAAVAGNELQLITDTDEVLRRIVADVDRATRSVHLEFYIWSDGGLVDELAEALMRAAARGVDCRLLVDSLGSVYFLNGPTPDRLREAGVHVVESLPVGKARMYFARLDLRNHRKIAVIDGRVAYTGSLNLVDPRFFKQDAGVGQWIDAMVRLHGPAVTVLEAIFAVDWALDRDGDDSGTLFESSVGGTSAGRCGDATVQVVPSGPGYSDSAMHQLLLSTIYGARFELVMTTPYFIPDEAMMTALTTAAGRGVEVTIIVPQRNDSRLVQHASRAHYEDLIEAGVRIELFEDGLLHAKTVTVDREVALVGTVNLDHRSIWLNFEVTLFIYDRDFCREVREMQATYGTRARPVDLALWRKRKARERFVDNAVRLFSPLL